MDELEKAQFRTHLTGKDIGTPGTPSTVCDHLRQLPGANVVQTAAKVLHHLERPGSAMDAERQLKLLGLFPSDLHAELEAALQAADDDKKVDVLFHRQQMLALQKLALAVSPQDPPVELGPRQKMTFVTAALQINDISDAITLREMRSLGGIANRNIARVGQLVGTGLVDSGS